MQNKTKNRFYYFMCFSYLLFTSCKNEETKEKVIQVPSLNSNEISLTDEEIIVPMTLPKDIDTSQFSFRLPVWEKQPINFKGPVKSVRLKNDRVKAYDNYHGIEMLGFPSFYMEFDQYGRCIWKQEVSKVDVLYRPKDSIIRISEKQIYRGHRWCYDMNQISQVLKRQPNTQQYPQFMALVNFDIPNSVNISVIREDTMLRNDDSYKYSLFLFPHFGFNSNQFNSKQQLDEYFITRGRIKDFNFDNSAFLSLNNSKDEGLIIMDSSYTMPVFHNATYGTKDSLLEINEMTQVKNTYNEENLVVKKTKLNYIARSGKGVYDYHRKTKKNRGNNYTKIKNDIYVYDSMNRLDSHYVVKENHPIYDKFYYSKNNSIPDSLYSVINRRIGFTTYVTKYCTSVFDKEGKIIEQRYYFDINRTKVQYYYTMIYSNYDKYNNWQTCKMYVRENADWWKEPKLCYQQDRRYEYYNK